MVLENKSYICRYFPEIDRFCISQDEKSNSLDYVIKSKLYSSFEYYRYIPGPNLTLRHIEKYLIKYPSECCFEVTKLCNLRCSTCISNSSQTTKKRLSISKFRKIIKKIDCARVTITGGEPILHPDIHDLIRLSSKKASNVILSTNGILLEIIENILMNFSNITLAISLHGPSEIHDKFVGVQGAYTQALECIQSAIINKFPIQIFSIMTRTTLNTLQKLCAILKPFKIKEHRLNLIKPSGRIHSEFVSYKDVISKVKTLNLPYKISIKRKDQPFFFINVNGKEEILNVRKYDKN